MNCVSSPKYIDLIFQTVGVGLDSVYVDVNFKVCI